jgi:MFS family permease
MQKFFGLRGPSLHHAIATLAGIGFVLFYYGQGVMSGLLTLPSFVDTFPQMNTSKSLSSEQTAYNSKAQEVVVAIYEIGCMMGALTTLWTSDKFGRRKVVFGGAIIMCTGALSSALRSSCPSSWRKVRGELHTPLAIGPRLMLVFRILTGVGNGFVTATVPMWQSECAKTARRGPMVMIEGALIIVGVALEYWIDFTFYFVDGQIN